MNKLNNNKERHLNGNNLILLSNTDNRYFRNNFSMWQILIYSIICKLSKWKKKKLYQQLIWKI